MSLRIAIVVNGRIMTIILRGHMTALGKELAQDGNPGAIRKAEKRTIGKSCISGKNHSLQRDSQAKSL